MRVHVWSKLDGRSLKEEVLDPKVYSGTWKALNRGLSSSAYPSAVLGYWSLKNPDVYYSAAVGEAKAQTVFDLSSVSKVYATATLAAKLIEAGKLQFEDPVQKYFPKYKYPEIRIRHLLAHTAGLVWWKPFYEELKVIYGEDKLHLTAVEDRQKKMRELVFAVPPEVKVDERALYSDLSFLILGFVLEEILQMPLDEAVRKFVWEPLEIENSFYTRVTAPASEVQLKGVAPTETCPWRKGTLKGQVHDDNCWSMGGYGGHAGCFGTLRDLVKFTRALHEGFIEKNILEKIWTRVSLPKGCDRTLGWDTPSKEGSLLGNKFSRNSVGHWGFTGTSLWIDRDAGLAIILLTNRVHPTRENNQIKIFRPEIHNALRSDIDSLHS